MPKPTKPGFGGFVTMLLAYIGYEYQKPPHNPTRSTQMMPCKALRHMASVDCVDYVGYNWGKIPRVWAPLRHDCHNISAWKIFRGFYKTPTYARACMLAQIAGQSFRLRSNFPPADFHQLLPLSLDTLQQDTGRLVVRVLWVRKDASPIQK